MTGPQTPAARSRRTPRLLAIVTLLALLLGTLPTPAGAAPVAGTLLAPAGQDEPTPEPSASPEVGATTAASAPSRLDLTFAQLGYADRTLNGSINTVTVVVPLRPGQAVGTDADVTVRFDVSPAIDQAASSITVAVNGSPRLTEDLTTDTGTTGSIVVGLEPTDRLPDTASIVLTIDTRLVQAGVTCPPAVDPARWLKLRGDSAVGLTRTSVDQSAGLADLGDMFFAAGGAPFARSVDPDPQPVTIVVGQGAEPDEFRAAGYVAAALGRWAAERQVEPTILFSDQIPPDQPTIVVTAGQRFAGALTWGDLSWDGAAWSAPSGVIPADRGFLALQRTPVPRLLISGSTAAAVLDGASALIQPGRADELSGSWAILTGRTTVTPDMRYPSWAGDRASFSDLGDDDHLLSGTGTQEITLTYDRPAGWELSGGSRLVLDVAAAGNLAPDASLAVSINGSAIGSMELTGGGQDPTIVGDPATKPTRQTGTFWFAPELLGAGPTGQDVRELRVTLTANLGIGATCLGLTAPSVTILDSSHWVLPHTTSDRLDLATFPAPLTGDPQSGVTPTIVVVPDWPSTGEMQAATRTIAAMARWSAGDQRLAPVLLPWSRLTDDDRWSANLVAVGSTPRNPLAGDMVGRYANAFRLPADVSSTAVYPPTSGFLALLPSPWRAGNAVLLVTAGSDGAVPLAASALEDPATLGALTGSVATVSGSDVPSTRLESLTRDEPAHGLVGRFGLDRWVVFCMAVAVIGLVAAVTWAVAGRGRPHRST